MPARNSLAGVRRSSSIAETALFGYSVPTKPASYRRKNIPGKTMPDFKPGEVLFNMLDEKEYTVFKVEPGRVFVSEDFYLNPDILKRIE